MFEPTSKLVMKELPSFISPDEELISYGYFMKKAGYLRNRFTLGYAQFWNQTFYVGLTEKRLVVLPIKRITGKVDKENVFSVDFNDAEVKGNKLIIQTANKNVFLKLSFVFGIKSISGLDKEKFIDELNKHKRSRINE